MRTPVPLTLRHRLTLHAGLLILLSVIVCAASLFLFTRKEDAEDLDASLLRQSEAIATLLADAPAPADALPTIRILLQANDTPRLAEIRLAPPGSPLLQTHPGPILLLPAPPPVLADPICQTKIINHTLYRVALIPSGDTTIAIAAQQETIAETLEDLIPVYAALALALLVAIPLASASLANRALAPINHLANATERITTPDNPHRLPTGQADPEIHRLSVLLNTMLDRLQTSFTLVQRFTADAAHEIKTPLAIIHGHIETALRSEQLASPHETALLTALRETTRLNRLVESLLLLARSDAGRLHLPLAPVNLSHLVIELLQDAEILAAPLALTLEQTVAPAIHVLADPAHLRQALLNLLDNAAKHNRPDGHIRLALDATGTHAHLTIANTGPAIPSDLLPRLFQRFQRADPSRTRADRHQNSFGLGLSITREILHAHNGQITLTANEPDNTAFTLTLPRHHP